jgi:hypothetical protein
VVPRTRLDDMEKRKILSPPGLELRPLGCPATRYTNCAIPAPHSVGDGVINYNGADGAMGIGRENPSTRPFCSPSTT